MSRIARVVIPELPHHVTQRGNRRQKVFFRDQDYEDYIDLFAEYCEHEQVAIWAYCLMPNHVHLVAVPKTSNGLARAIGDAHRRYTWRVNRRKKWTGYLWQGRFASCPLDDAHLYAAVRYVELNPVRAGMVQRPRDFPYSSAVAHTEGKDDRLVTVKPLAQRIGDWQAFLAEGLKQEDAKTLRAHERNGRHLGGEAFVHRIEEITGQDLRPGQRGRPKRNK